MTKFTQKYTIVQLFENMPVGTQFSSKSWPLHTTIVDTFSTNWSADEMIKELIELLHSHTQTTSIATEDRLLGDDGQIRVALLERTDDLVKLHYDLIELLQKGGLRLNDPQFAHDGFLPHSTVQPHARLNCGDEVTFDALSIIDMFPDQDPYQRTIIATIKIG